VTIEPRVLVPRVIREQGLPGSGPDRERAGHA
jgi:hypothetical protein